MREKAKSSSGLSWSDVKGKLEEMAKKRGIIVSNKYMKRMEKNFHRIDRNSSGKISSEELEKFLSRTRRGRR